jgi:carboxypeptidase C (cathepsin A)
MTTKLLLSTSAILLALAPAAAQKRPAAAEMQHRSDEPAQPEQPVHANPDKPAMGEDVVQASPIEDAQPKPGKVTVAGRTISYKAIPGTLTLRNDDGEPIASMFYVAYIADQPRGAAPRPITFAYNGGPGSSSMWLHMGSVAPIKVLTPTAGAQAAAPFPVVENPETILGHSDIVFLDAVGTGLSRPLGKAKGADFFGTDPDIDAFARGIMRFLTKYDRWNSPKFLFGESYGTLRSAGLVYTLQDRGVQMNGVILLSSILNYGIRQPGYDQIYLSYLPSYAADAWYHNKLPNRPAALEPFLSQVRAWAIGPYATALQKGADLPEAERTAIAQQMSAYTGISPKFILQNDLRVDLSRFRKELLRDQGKTIGRLDARFTGTDVDDAGDTPEYDAADRALSGPYIGALNAYLFGTLGYKTRLSYRPNYYPAVQGGKWDQKHSAPGSRGQKMGLADTALDLSQAMRENPRLKVLSMNGYYDMATPFFGAEYDLKHMSLPAELRPNLSFTYYESGHMVYVNPAVRSQFTRDMGAFIDTASRRGE